MASEDAKWDAFKPEHRPPFVEIPWFPSLWTVWSEKHRDEPRGLPLGEMELDEEAARRQFKAASDEVAAWLKRPPIWTLNDRRLRPAVELEPGDAT